ncbi:hypothetical protein ACFW4M_16455 [Streptomyces sp. NPDC058794]|uniref:hypothetical protein n=1 Tax=unclassified Streptomyces TaxID=2593676 RepID=UPI0036BFC06C
MKRIAATMIAAATVLSMAGIATASDIGWPVAPESPSATTASDIGWPAPPSTATAASDIGWPAAPESPSAGIA